MCHCGCCVQSEPKKKRLLVVTGGTLMNTGHPVAMEAGHLLHVVTLIDPAIYWADMQGVEPVAHGLRFISHGVPIG
jgi:hypothetical protein